MSMARNPKQDANLRPVRTKSEARERGTKGGINSGISRGNKSKSIKTLSQTAIDNISQKDKDKIVGAVISYAQRGSESHIKLLMELLGESMDNAGTDSNITINIGGSGDYGV